MTAPRRVRGQAPAMLLPEDPEGPIWSRLRGESDIWWRRFAAYRDMLPEERSLRAVLRAEWRRRYPTRECPYPNNRWVEAARDWKWRERADAFDELGRQRKREAIEEARRAAAARRTAALDGVAAVAAKVMVAPNAHLALRVDQAADIVMRVQDLKRKEAELEQKRDLAAEARRPEDGLAPAAKVYIVMPGQPDPRDEL